MSSPGDERREFRDWPGLEGLAIDPIAMARAIRAAGLADILEAQGAIDAIDRERIEASIARRLGPRDRRAADAADPRDGETEIWRHGGPATVSWHGGPPRVDAEVSTVDAIDGPRDRIHGLDANGFLLGADGRAGGAPEAPRRFTFLRHHKSGGLGVVSIARDEELHREVAYKEIREALAHQEEKRARFILEAEITSALEHPGIVPVYALGRDSRGRPFYAMKFIRGETLKETIAATREQAGPAPARRLALRELVGRLIDVCDATHYAHSRGVIHRDIKPTNIMIGKFGETLVVDWGLAKFLGRKGRAGPAASIPPRAAGGESTIADDDLFERHAGSTPGTTPPGSAVGTPGFMSPEQARGDLDALGAWSDVYSLGATLYYILTGRMTIEALDPILYLRRLAAGDIAHPRTLDPAAPPALGAICMMALATEPGDRYPSAEAFAADLKHWLADEPVRAYRDPPTTRVFRWVRRHKPLVSGAAMTLIAAVVVLALTLGWVYAEKTRADRFLARWGDAASDTIEQFLFQDWQSDGTVDETRKMRLTDQAIELYKEHLQQRPQAVEAVGRLVLFARRSANYHRMIGVDFATARAQYGDALRACEACLAAAPDDRVYQDHLIETYIDRAELSKAEERWDDLDADHARALELSRKWPTLIQARARLLASRGIVLMLRGRLDEAGAAVGEAIALLRARIDADGNARDRELLLRALRTRIQIEIDRDQTGKARASLDEAMAELGRYVAIVSDNYPEAMHMRATFLMLVEAMTVEPGGALKESEEAVRIARKLAGDYGVGRVFKTLLAQTINGFSRARIDAGAGDLPVIAADLAEAEAALVGLERDPALRAELGLTRVLLGQVEARRGGLVKARGLIADGSRLIAEARSIRPRDRALVYAEARASQALEELEARPTSP